MRKNKNGLKHQSKTIKLERKKKRLIREKKKKARVWEVWIDEKNTKHYKSNKRIDEDQYSLNWENKMAIKEK